jgi:hypothetical protein
MKRIFVTALTALVANAAYAQTYSAPAQPRRAPQPQPPPPITSRDIGGVIPRAIRGGNPLQMLNPRAPARYGSAQQSVMFDPRVPGKWNGIRFLTIYF